MIITTAVVTYNFRLWQNQLVVLWRSILDFLWNSKSTSKYSISFNPLISVCTDTIDSTVDGEQDLEIWNQLLLTPQAERKIAAIAKSTSIIATYWKGKAVMISHNIPKSRHLIENDTADSYLMLKSFSLFLWIQY